MKPDYLFTSDRLGFRGWQPADAGALAAMCGDEQVMEFFPSPLSFDESQELLQTLQHRHEENNFTFYAMELIDSQEFAGFIGLNKTSFNTPFSPCVEIGWRLVRKFWNRGLATEGALRCLEFAKTDLGLFEVYSFTPVPNVASERVMQKIGMTKTGEFMHPAIDPGHRLAKHVLYYIEL